ncbi:MAG: amino acid synthesis family protein [Bordetella sp.]|uniref:amino acid synthesis family protein n=1 Tax=Bordetella sp. TaxID=28081 RepID=UPI003F7C9D88
MHGIELTVRKWSVSQEETLTTELGMSADGEPLHKYAIAATIKNPYAGQFGPSLEPIVAASESLGHEFARRIKAAVGDRAIESYGKACIVGTAGEYDHGNAFITTVFAEPIRAAVGGAKAWIPSTGKRASLGSQIDVPLAHKDALYVRSHYDTYTLAFPDGPAPDEVVVVVALATRGRLRARLGGLKSSEIKGENGLY